jgi:nitrite reductase/ring-hydroxylating ferredoxin subunit
MEQNSWKLVGTRADIESRKLRRAQVGNIWVGLLIFNDKIYAIDDECPHRGAFLSDGKVDDQGFVACPLHAWEYNVTNGNGREDWEGCVASFPVEERDGFVYVGEKSNSPDASTPP